jgi:3-oxoacyl-[acyl-carrier protein] reductase
MMMAVMITGVSRGIGKALIDEYREAGVKTIGVSRGNGVEMVDHDGHIQIGFDWEDFDGLGEVLERMSREQGWKVEVLINNAGVLIKDKILEVRYEDFEAQMRTNVWNSLMLFRSLYNRDIIGQNGHIVKVSSMGGVQGVLKFPGLFAYSASKAAMITLTEVLDAEFRGEGLAFNSLALGAVNTEMLNEAFPGYISQVDPENMAKYIRQFADGSGRFMSGKLIQVAKSNPEG